MQFGYPYLIRLSFFEMQSDPNLVLNCRIRLDRDFSFDVLTQDCMSKLLDPL